MELVFSLIRDGDGGFMAACLSHCIFTHGSTWGELCANVWDAVSSCVPGVPKPTAIRFRHASGSVEELLPAQTTPAAHRAPTRKMVPPCPFKLPPPVARAKRG